MHSGLKHSANILKIDFSLGRKTKKQQMHFINKYKEKVAQIIGYIVKDFLNWVIYLIVLLTSISVKTGKKFPYHAWKKFQTSIISTD